MVTASERQWAERLEQFRLEKDRFFLSSPQSPLPTQLRPTFSGLAYFPIDPIFRVTAGLRRHPNPETILMATSTGQERAHLRYATLEFSIGESLCHLIAFKAAPAPHVHHHHHAEGEPLFIAFRDATSGNETYGASRYLDVEEPSGDTLELDFNYAYNPYCAYSEAYTCPLPPPENWLKVPIRAGEKAFEAH